jgi:S-DNA-T family DNA segregation ATPase FtsK/SpoIIIE
MRPARDAASGLEGFGAIEPTTPKMSRAPDHLELEFEPLQVLLCSLLGLAGGLLGGSYALGLLAERVGDELALFGVFALAFGAGMFFGLAELNRQRRLSSNRREKQSQPIPSFLTMLQLLEVKTVEELNIYERWHQNRPGQSLAVPIGMAKGGEPVYLDVQAHGPHGLIVGWGNSGKTSFLRTYLSLLATHFHPRDLAILAIDFRGGDLFKELEGIPHLVGTIAELDRASPSRWLMALAGEHERRKRILVEAGKAEGTILESLEQYLALTHQKPSLEHIPRLLVACDEFTDLMDYPELFNKLCSLARSGGTVGLHLLLVTGRPGHVKNFEKLEADLGFRLAFKCNSMDSKLTLKTSDAYDAVALNVPGQGYLKVGVGEIYKLIQASWGGAHYGPGSDREPEPKSCGTVEDAPQVWEPIDSPEPEGSRDRPEPSTQILAVSNRIREICDERGIARRDCLWLPPLAARRALSDLEQMSWNGSTWVHPSFQDRLVATLGTIDDVRNRVQPPLIHNFLRSGNLVVYGGPQSGASTLLQTLVTSLVAKTTPQQTTFYLLDFGQSFSRFQNLPHVGERLSGEDHPATQRLLRYLLKQLGVRKQLPIKSFDESLLPALFLMVDGYGKFCSLYPEEQETLETIAKEGFALGVFVVLTATTPSSLRANLLNAMGRSLCLRLAESDRSEYPLAVARPEGETEGGIAINHRPGSGICEGWLEFQIAVPAENEIALDSLFQEMQKHWTGEPAQVPVDPTVESGFTWKGP